MSYLQPSSTTPIPGGLSLQKFIQTVLVGISGVDGTLVRPRWQQQPPKQPDIDINWIAFGITPLTPDANGALTVSATGVVSSNRHETLEIGCAIYGPDALDVAGILRDGFQIPQNLEALTAANMGLIETGPARRIPELTGGRFIDRYEMSIFIRRQIQRVYAVPTLLSSVGTIQTEVDGGDYEVGWDTEQHVPLD